MGREEVIERAGEGERKLEKGRKGERNGRSDG